MKKKNMIILIICLLLAAFMIAVMYYPYEATLFGLSATLLLSFCFLVGCLTSCKDKRPKNLSVDEYSGEIEYKGEDFYFISKEYKMKMDSIIQNNENLISAYNTLAEVVKDSNKTFAKIMKEQQNILETVLDANKTLQQQIEELKEENKLLRKSFLRKELNDSAQLQVTAEDAEEVETIDAKVLEEKPKYIWIEYELLGSNLYQMGLMPRTVDLLESAGITKVGQLISHTREEIRLIDHIGEKKLRNIDEFLKTVNLSFGTEVKEENGMWFVQTTTE